MQHITPKKAVRGNLPIFRGVLNGLLISGLMNLRWIRERLTALNAMSEPRLVTSATLFIFPTRTKTMERAIVTAIATYGVPLFELTLAKILGSDPSFAIPYTILDAMIRITRVVPAVANIAQVDIRMNALLPSTFDTARASGADEPAKVLPCRQIYHR